MKKTDKNIILITAGGIGLRAGYDTPKQYLMLCGKPVIAYVIEACKKSQHADAIVVAAKPAYHEDLKETYGVDVAESGEVLNITKRNSFDYIRENSSCEKLVVVEGVRPLLEHNVIDRFFEVLDDYDTAACARKITDSLGHYGEWIVNREEYYTLNPPEGFRFDLLDKHFKADSPLTESIQQLPDTTSVYLDFDVPYFDKITYPGDLQRMEMMMRYMGRGEQ